MTPEENETVTSTNELELSADAGSSSTEATNEVTAVETAETTVAEETRVAEEAGTEKTEEDVAEPETTLDEEVKADEEVTVTGVPEGTVAPQEAPVDAEYLSVVNASGETKYVLPASEAVKNAQAGGFSVREATEDEIADYKRINRIA